jgi:hypothetical protein
MIRNSRTALAASICTVVAAMQAEAATFSVTNSNDSGAGSLRDALAQANGNAEADTIDLSAISGQTINLTSGYLYTGNDEIVIDGSGVTIDAGGNSGVMRSYGTDLTLRELTLTGGSSEVSNNLRGGGFSGIGGGIYAFDGSLTLEDATVTGNTADDVGGGIAFYADGGALEILDSVISGNTAPEAGGVVAYSGYGDIRIEDSLISGNEATGSGAVPERSGESVGWMVSELGRQQRGFFGNGFAGGAFLFGVEGTVDIRRSTISDNRAVGAGGLAAYNFYGEVLVEDSTISGNVASQFAGGGVMQSKYRAVLRNSTISGNSATENVGGFVAYTDSPSSGPGRGVPAPGEARIEFTTITANSAENGEVGGLGISGEGTHVIQGSVISGNSAPVDPDVGFQYATESAQADFTLIGQDPSDGTLNKDATSSSLTGQNPLLGPLADNGGPTFTHRPGDGSPLIDAVPAGSVGCGSPVATDQRGTPRPSADGCDIGALERGAVGTTVPVPVLDRLGLLLMAGLLGLAGWLGLRRRPERGS